MAKRADKDIEVVFSGEASNLRAAEQQVEEIFRSYGVSLEKVQATTKKNGLTFAQYKKQLISQGDALHNLAARYDNYRNQLHTTTKATAKLDRSVELTTERYKQMSEELKKAGVRLDQVKNTEQKVAENQRLQLGNVLKYSILYGGVAGALYKVNDALSSIVKRGMELEGTKAVFESAFGGSKEAARQLEFVTGVAHKYSLELSEMRVQYRKFATSASLSGATLNEVQSIYQNMSKAARGLHLSNDDLGGAFRAITQIFSKGKVQAEELRGQLGERLPGAMAIMAKAVGVSTAKLNKMMEQGELTSDAMQGFAQAYANTISQVGLESALNSVQALGVKLTNTWDDFAQAVFTRFEPALKSSLRSLESITRWGAEFVQSSGLNVLITTLELVGIAITAHLLKKFIALVPRAAAGTKALLGFNAATLATAATMDKSGVAGGRFGKIMGALGEKGGIIIAAGLAVYYYRKELGELLGVWDSVAQAASAHKATLRSVEEQVRAVTHATKLQIQATEESVNKELAKAKATRSATNVAYTDAVITLNRYKKTLEGMDANRSTGNKRFGYVDYEDGSTKLKELTAAVTKAGRAHKVSQDHVDSMNASVKALSKATANRTKVLKVATLLNERSNEGEEAAAKAYSKRLESEAASLEAGEKLINQMKRKNLTSQGNVLALLKMKQAYKDMTPEMKKIAEAEARLTMASRRRTGSIRGKTKAQREAIKVEKEAIKAKKDADKVQQDMANLIEKEITKLKLKNAQLNKNRITAFKIMLDSKKIVGLKRKELIQMKKEQIALKDKLKLDKKIATVRAKALKQLEKNRLESEEYQNGIEGLIPAVEGLTKAENELNRTYLEGVAANKVKTEQNKRYQADLDKQAAKILALKEKLGQLTKGAQAHADAVRHGTHNDKEAIKVGREKIAVMESQVQLMKKLSQTINDLLSDALPGFADLGDKMGDVSDSIAKLASGGSLKDVGAQVMDMMAPFKGDGAGDIVGNAANAYSLAGSMGLSKDAQIGAALGSVAAQIAGLPPQIGQAVGAAWGTIWNSMRAKGHVTFDQNIDASGGEKKYDRDFADYEKKGIVRTTGFGEFGVSDRSKKYGRVSEERKRDIQVMLDTAEAADNLMIKIMTEGQVQRAKAALNAQVTTRGTKGKDSQTFLDSRLNLQIASLDKEIQALIPSTATYIEKLEILATVQQAMDKWSEPLLAFGLNLGRTAGQITAVTVELVKAAGSAEKLGGLLQNYASKLYTPMEQLALQQNIASASINKYNDELAKEGKSRITSTAELKNYIEHLRKSGKLNTEEGRNALIRALEMVDAFTDFDAAVEGQDKILADKVKENADAKKKQEQELTDANQKAQDAREADKKARIASALELAEIRKKELEDLNERNRVTTSLHDMGLQATAGLENLAGGIEALQAVSKTYADNVYTEEENKAIAVANAGKKLSLLAEELGLDANALDTRGELKDMVNKLTNAEGEMTDVRREQILALMQAAAATALVEDANKTASSAMSTLPSKLANVVGGFNDAIPPLETMKDKMVLAARSLEDSGEAITNIGVQATTAIEAIQQQLNTLTLPETNSNMVQSQEDLNAGMRELIQQTKNSVSADKNSSVSMTGVKANTEKTYKLLEEFLLQLEHQAQLTEDA